MMLPVIGYMLNSGHALQAQFASSPPGIWACTVSAVLALRSKPVSSLKVLWRQQDWNYVVAGDFEVTLELSKQKTPPDLKHLWQNNRQALLDYVLTAALGGWAPLEKAHCLCMSASPIRGMHANKLRPSWYQAPICL
jgi:hypothetical protein